jgi:hypothetical protein
VTADQEAQLCTDIGRIATALESVLQMLKSVATVAQKAAAEQAASPPARPAHTAKAPQRRVTA